MHTIPVIANVKTSSTGYTIELDALIDLDDPDQDLEAAVTGATYEECKAKADRIVQRLSEEQQRPTKVGYLLDGKYRDVVLDQVFADIRDERQAELAQRRQNLRR